MTLRLIPPCLILTALAMGGCGTSTRITTVPANTGRLAFSLDEYRILPRNVSVPAGPLRITVANHGVLTHNLVIALRDRDSNGNRVILTKTTILKPGASESVSATLHPGRYTISSTLANQADLGMAGKLTVRP